MEAWLITILIINVPESRTQLSYKSMIQILIVEQMIDIIRDAPLGQIIRYIFRDRILLYPEEKPDFDFKPYTQPSSTISANAARSSIPGDNAQMENAIPLEKKRVLLAD